ncbi:uncharacterized protein LOC144478242 [Augochlora pura]
MSYVEHGPRIFLTGRPNSRIPLTYGDYVLPRKRLEGRLKLHDSCSDIRAWSPNSLENSRYFRELNEHDSSIGKIIPVNVVVDNIIKLNSCTQTELQIVKKELQKYKSLKLTTKQKEQLQNLNHNQKLKEPTQSNHTTDLLVNITKSAPIIHSNSYLSIHLPLERNLKNENDKLIFVNQSTYLRPYSSKAFDIKSSTNNYALVTQFKSDAKTVLTEDYIERTPQWVEYIDIALQVEQETRDVGVQFNQVDKYANKIITTSVMSQTSFTYKSSEEDDNLLESDKISFQTNNEEESVDYDTSYSGSFQDIGTPSKSSSELTESDKSIIIQKDSEIIALKHKLRAWDLELDEIRGFNKKLKISLQEKEKFISSQEENLKMLHGKLTKIEHDYNCEIENLKSKLHGSKYLISQLKQELSKKCESSYLQSQEIEKLKLYAKEATTLKLEQEMLLKKLQKMELLSEKLEKQNDEQNCIFADQEKEIKRLLSMISKSSIAYEKQIESLNTEICEKTIEISQYEQQVHSMKQETSEFVNNLKHALNNLEEFNGFCEDVCNCINYDLDITAEANHLLNNINVMMTRFQSYKIERQNLLQQIENLKHSVDNDKQKIHVNQDLKNMISDILKYEDDADSRKTDKKDSIIVLNVKQNKCNPNEIECEDISSSVNSEHSSNGITDNEYNNYIIKLNRKNSINEIDEEIFEYFSYFIVKLHSLTKKLQVYLEIERPLMIEQIYNFYQMLQETESAINGSQDLALKKQRISELSVVFNKRQTKYETYMTQLPNDLSQIQIKIIEFIKTILNQLFNAILYVERNNLSDKQINQAFATCFRFYIGKMDAAMLGAGNQRMQIIEEIEKQQRELQKKSKEIVYLKDELKQYAKRGEGDSVHSGESNVLLKEQLAKVETDLSAKDELLLQLQEQHETLLSELFKSNENYNVLKSQCKNYEKELEIKMAELKEIQLKHLDTTTEQNLKKIKMEFLELQIENKDLKDKINKSEIEEKYREIEGLKDENVMLIQKLKEAENKLSEMNQTILSLTEQNNKIDIIYLMQEDLVKLDKNGKKLKSEFNHLKTQLTNEQNKTKEVDNSLNAIEHENEILKTNIADKKNDNFELSRKLYTETIEEKLRSKLYTLSNKLCERILHFNKVFDLEECILNEQSIESLKDKYLKYQNVNENVKENEIEEIQNQQLCNDKGMLNVQYKMDHQGKYKKLHQQLDMKNSEIKDLQDTIRRLEQANTKLCIDRESQTEQYQDKLTTMKKNYDSSLNELYEKHGKYVDRLQKRYEDIINNETTSVSKNLLQSLDMKELTEPYESIAMIMDNNSNFIQMKDDHQRFYENNVHKEFYELNETQKNVHRNMYEKEIPNKLDSTILREENNSYLQNQWQLIISSQIPKYSIRTQNYKLREIVEENYGYIDSSKILGLENKYEKQKQIIKDSTFDQQRWNFINQCSVYHKMGNN